MAVRGVVRRSESRSALLDLLDRQPERAALDGLLGDVRAGRGRALVVRGEAGVGKSALLLNMEIRMNVHPSAALLCRAVAAGAGPTGGRMDAA